MKITNHLTGLFPLRLLGQIVSSISIGKRTRRSRSCTGDLSPGALIPSMETYPRKGTIPPEASFSGSRPEVEVNTAFGVQEDWTRGQEMCYHYLRSVILATSEGQQHNPRVTALGLVFSFKASINPPSLPPSSGSGEPR